MNLATEIIEVSIPKDFGKSFEELKKDIQKSYKANGYGCSDHFKALQSGYSISFTDNRNFQQGINNGGGAGYYAHLNGVGMVRTIRLQNV